MSCTRCETPLETGDLRCSICALPVPALPGAPSPHAQVLRCTECGAAVAFSAHAQAPHCGFCGATMAVEQPLDPVETAQLRAPFRVDREAAEQALRGWLGKRRYFAPPALASDAVLESLAPLSWAAWCVSADAQVAWTADSNAGSRRSDWAPHAGTTRLAFRNIVVPASRGLSRKECRALIPYYELSKLTSSMDGEIESFDAQRSAARAQVRDAIEAVARVRVEPQIPGSRFRKISVACLLEQQTTDRLALPAWILAYRYRGAPYRAIVHGQRADIVVGTAPRDWAKLARLIALIGIAALVAVLLLSGCGGSHQNLDAPDFGEHCEPTPPTFAPITGRAAVQGALNVHVDAGGLIKIDTTSDLLLVLDLVQTGTQVSVAATVCKIQVPDVPLAGQDMPIQFSIPDATLASVGTVSGTATLSSSDQTCSDFTSAPITLVLGARLDPTALATAPLPAADSDGAFTACAPSADTGCAIAIGTGCACDQEGDGNAGATLIAHNVPAVMLDQVYVTLRTTFSLHGQVWSTDLVKGQVDAALATGVLACRLTDGTPCPASNVRTVATLNPVVTQQPGNPSTFRAVRVDAAATCADIIANEATLFPR